MPVSDERSRDTRTAWARVSDEEPLLTSKGTRLIDATSISLEWGHGNDEPHLTVMGLPLFASRKGGRSGSDYIARRFRPSDYGAELPQWIEDFCDRHNPNPVSPRVWREGDPEPPGDAVLLRVEHPVEGARFLRRTPEGGWWSVERPDEATDPEGWPWALAYGSGAGDFGVRTEVPSGR
jgi:hypothetical protein